MLLNEWSKQMTKATVTKIANNRFVVEGVIAVIAEKVVNEPFANVYRTRREAEIAAERSDRINAEALAYVAEIREARAAAAANYRAARAARANTQTEMFS